MERNILSKSRHPAEEMMGLVTGSWISQVIYVAAKLGLADRLAEGPKTAAELAFATQVDERSLYRLLRAAASIGIFRELDDSQFESTPLGDTLRDDSPHSVRATAIMMGAEHYVAWGHLLDGIRTGRTPFELAYELPVFDFFDRHPEAAETFHRAMFELTSQTHVAVAKAYDFSSLKTVVDVGGGHGTLLAAILKAHPTVRGVLFDLPKVVRGASELLERKGVADRCEIAGGDFFESVPAGGDAYILSTVIHDWEDERSVAILRNIANVIPPDGKLLLVERVLAGANEQDFGKFADLNMLVMTGGQERTADEFERLLAMAGFRLTRILPTASSSSIVEAVKA